MLHMHHLEETRWEFRRPPGGIMVEVLQHYPGLNQPCWPCCQINHLCFFLEKNEFQLKAKRDRLLDRLHENGEFDELTLTLAKAEAYAQSAEEITDGGHHIY